MAFPNGAPLHTAFSERSRYNNLNESYGWGLRSSLKIGWKAWAYSCLSKGSSRRFILGRRGHSWSTAVNSTSPILGKDFPPTEYLETFHLLLQIHSTFTLQAFSNLSFPRACVNYIFRFSCLMVSVGFSRWGALREKCEGRRSAFSQLPLCDYVPLLKVTSPLSDPLYAAFSVWV